MTYKTQTVWPNTTQNMTWFEFWNPGQAAALKAETQQNKDIMEQNRLQDLLEAEISLKLTNADNLKFIIVIAIMAVTLIIYTLN